MLQRADRVLLPPPLALEYPVELAARLQRIPYRQYPVVAAHRHALGGLPYLIRTSARLVKQYQQILRVETLELVRLRRGQPDRVPIRPRLDHQIRDLPGQWNPRPPETPPYLPPQRVPNLPLGRRRR